MSKATDIMEEIKDLSALKAQAEKDCDYDKWNDYHEALVRRQSLLRDILNNRTKGD